MCVCVCVCVCVFACVCVCVCVCVGRVRLEAFSDNSGKLQLSLQEIIEWLTAKDEELSEQLPIGGDVGAVQHHSPFPSDFRQADAMFVSRGFSGSGGPKMPRYLTLRYIK